MDAQDNILHRYKKRGEKERTEIGDKKEQSTSDYYPLLQCTVDTSDSLYIKSTKWISN